MTFEIGDKVVHPAYGAGKIVAIKEKRLLEHANQYYVIFMPQKKMTVMVPTGETERTELRPVSMGQVLVKLWDVLRQDPPEPTEVQENRQEEIRANLGRGEILTIARDLRGLSARERARKLTQTDRVLMQQARDFIVGEVALAHDVEMAEALRLVSSALKEEVAV